MLLLWVLAPASASCLPLFIQVYLTGAPDDSGVPGASVQQPLLLGTVLILGHCQ